MSDKEVLSLAETAELLGISKSLIYKLIGKIKKKEIGEENLPRFFTLTPSSRLIFFQRTQILQWLARR